VHLKTIIFLTIIALLLAAAYLVFSYERLGPNKSSRRLRVRQNLYVLQDKFNNLIYDEQAENLLKEAGYPLRITGRTYSLLRIIMVILLLLYFAFDTLINGVPFNMGNIVFALSLYLLTAPKSYMPISYILSKVKSLYTIEKNRECFLLYSMLLNEFNRDDDTTFQLYAILQKMAVYFNKIKPAMLKMLSQWKRNPEAALDLFAKEVGTAEAKDLAQILKSIDASNAVKARDVIKSRYQQFQTSRHETHRRMLKNRDLLGYTLVFIPMIAILFNMLNVYSQMIQDLLKFSNGR